MRLLNITLPLCLAVLLPACASAQTPIATPARILPKADGSAAGILLLPNNDRTTQCAAANYATCKPLIFQNNTIDATNLTASVNFIGNGVSESVPAFSFFGGGSAHISRFLTTGVGGWDFTGVSFGGHTGASWPGTTNLLMLNTTGDIGTSGQLTFFENTGLSGDGIVLRAPSGGVATSGYTINLPGTGPSVTGQALAWVSGSSYAWTAFMTNPLTTTGDIIYSSSGATAARLGIGSTGTCLMPSGGVPTWRTDCLILTGSQTITGTKLFNSSTFATFNGITWGNGSGPSAGVGWGSVAGIDASNDYLLFFDATATQRLGLIHKLSGSTLDWMNVTMHYVPNNDNTWDIGISGTQIRNFYLGGSVIVDGTTGVSATKTVRDAAGTGTCTLVFNGGILTGGSC